MANRGLPRMAGGIMARERAAWQRPCVVHENRGEHRPAAAVVDTTAGPQPICEACIPVGERLGYTIRREPLR